MYKGISAALLASTAVLGACATAQANTEPNTDVVTAEEQAAMTPAQVLADLKAGNERFVSGNGTQQDWLAQAETTARDGQFPKAIVLSCLDSRVPVEIVFDQGIGDLFVGRVAGNFENVDMLGSFEFGTAVAGSDYQTLSGTLQFGAGQTEAILLDPVYSAKGGAGLIDLVRKGHFKRGEKVVFLHTGGAIGLTGYTHEFDVAAKA